ncbi:MAG: P-type conjugative transfer protein TrbJ [Betaproteobacteria bacterium]|nr:P-type conjugative transfer protein TrbJ [Betaproteobacteria bacterium]
MFDRKRISAVIVLSGLFASPAVRASGMIDGATLPEQIVQEATAVQRYEQSVQQTYQGFQSLYNQARNLQSLAQNPVQNLSPLMGQLISAVQTGTNLSYAGQNITGMFQKLYSNWKPGQDFGQEFANWRNTTLANLENELTAAGLQAADFTNESNALNQAVKLSQSATGRLQAIQAGTAVSAMLAQQVQELRQLIMNEQQSQIAYREQMLNSDKDGAQQAQYASTQFLSNDKYSTYKNTSPDSLDVWSIAKEGASK